MFESLLTLHNCFVFGNVSDDDTKPSFDSLQHLNYFPPDRDQVIHNIADTLDSCLTAYCESLPKCMNRFSDNENLPLYSFESNDTFYHGRGYLLINAICSDVPSRLNPDIGGIGVGNLLLCIVFLSLTRVKVYVSYWLQIGLAISGFIATVFWRWVFPNGCIIFLALRHGWKVARRSTQRINQISRRHLSRLVAALTDFHKSQCFFMMATNVAALAVIGRGGLDPQSLQQIYNSWVFLKLISINGFLPITFTLTNLHMVGMLSWYLNILSSLTIILSVATFVAVGKFNPSESEMKNLEQAAASDGPKERNYKRPGVFCYNPIDLNSTALYGSALGSDSNGRDSSYMAMIVFCVIIMILLLAHRINLQGTGFAHDLRSSVSAPIVTSVRTVCDRLYQTRRRRALVNLEAQMVKIIRTCTSCISNLWTSTSRLIPLQKLQCTRPWQLISRAIKSIDKSAKKRLQALGWKGLAILVLKTAVILTILILYIIFFTSYLLDLAWFAQNDSFSRSWNFGQVVAITIWAPPICELIHLEIRKSNHIEFNRGIPSICC